LEWAANLPEDRMVVAYCAWHDEATSARAAHQLRQKGINAVALQGGIDDWRAQFSVDPITAKAW